MLSTFADGALFGVASGTASPRVLALHGWGRDHGDWGAALDGLDAVALDLPGFGASPPPPEPWGSALYAQAVAPVLADMARPVVVVGHSFGGRVALQLAAACPDRVGALVLTGVPGLWPETQSAARRPKPALRYRVVRWLARRGVVSDARLEAARQRFGSADYRAATGVLRDVLVAVLAERYDDVLRSLSCPVHLVWGATDTAAPVAQARAAAQTLGHVDLDEIDGVDHFTLAHAPTRVRAAIDRALSEIGPGASA